MGPVGDHHDGADGTSICKRCYDQSTHRCTACGERRIVAAYLETGPFCPRCHRGQPAPRGQCGQFRPVYTDLGSDGRSLCRDCARAGMFGRCAGCSATGPVDRGRTRGGRLYCAACWSAGTCSGCGQRRKLCAEWPIGSFCQPCYAKVRRRVARCPSCDERHPLIGLDAHGERICGPCAGIDVDYRCAGCGESGYLIIDRLCERCLATRRARELLTGPDGAVADALAPFLQALIEADSPGAVLQWLALNKPAAPLLARLAAHPDTLGHETLDGFPQTLALHRLRQSLVHTGVLPARADYLERLVPLAGGSSGRPADDTGTSGAHLRALDGAPPGSTAVADLGPVHLRVVRRRPRQAACRASTAHLDRRRRPHPRGPRPGPPRPLAAQPTPQQRGVAREFVGWLRRAGLIGNIDIPKPRAQGALEPIGEDERWDHLRHCLTDERLPLDARAGGALALLYGLPVSRITELRTDDVTRRDGRTFLHLGVQPLLLPPAVAALLDRQALHAVSVTVLQRSNPTGPAWLFPGGFPGRPARDALYRKLRTHIPHIRRSRSAALITLAAELPAPILADLLGLNINTAVQWTQHASRDWSRYLEARIGAPKTSQRVIQTVPPGERPPASHTELY